MAFCKYCGKELAEGEVCVCQAPQAEPVVTEAEPQAEPQAVSQTPNAFVGALNDVWKMFLALIKKPVSVAKEFVANATPMHCYVMIGIQAVAVALLVTILAAKYNGVLESAMGLASLGESSMSAVANEAIKQATFSIPLVILVGLVLTAGMAFLIPALFTVAAKIFKGKADYSTMLKVSSVNSLVLTPFVLVGVVLSFFFSAEMGMSAMMNPMGLISAFIVPVVVACLGMSLGSFLMMALLPDVMELDAENHPYAMFIVWLLSAVAFYLVFSLVGWPLCAPAALKTLL